MNVCFSNDIPIIRIRRKYIFVFVYCEVLSYRVPTYSVFSSVRIYLAIMLAYGVKKMVDIYNKHGNH